MREYGIDVSEHVVKQLLDKHGYVKRNPYPPTCNAPLREGKAWMYEGGVREPLIVKWPGIVEAGTNCDHPVTSPDFYPNIS